MGWLIVVIHDVVDVTFSLFSEWERGIRTSSANSNKELGSWNIIYFSHRINFIDEDVDLKFSDYYRMNENSRIFEYRFLCD